MKAYSKPSIYTSGITVELLAVSGPGANDAGSPNVDDGDGPGANDAIFGPLPAKSVWDE